MLFINTQYAFDSYWLSSTTHSFWSSDPHREINRQVVGTFSVLAWLFFQLVELKCHKLAKSFPKWCLFTYKKTYKASATKSSPRTNKVVQENYIIRDN